jgi:hypothetical protein
VKEEFDVGGVAVLVNVIDTAGVEGGRTADNAMDLLGRGKIKIAQLGHCNWH